MIRALKVLLVGKQKEFDGGLVEYLVSNCVVAVHKENWEEARIWLLDNEVDIIISDLYHVGQEGKFFMAHYFGALGTCYRTKFVIVVSEKNNRFTPIFTENKVVSRTGINGFLPNSMLFCDVLGLVHSLENLPKPTGPMDVCFNSLELQRRSRRVKI